MKFIIYIIFFTIIYQSNSSSISFRDDLAIKMCKAKMAYTDELVIHSRHERVRFECYREDMESLYFETDKIFNITYTGYDIFGYVSYNREKKLIDVVFRGTKLYDIYNWIENLSFMKISPYQTTPICDICDRISIHRGFYSAYYNLKYILIKTLVNVEIECPECNNIQFIGHSMGGAIASIALFDLYHNLTLYNNISLYTYGAPRVGNNLYASTLNKYNINEFRIVNNKDIVPHILPKRIGYHHNKLEIWIHKINGTDNIKICDGLLSKGTQGEDKTCSNSLKFPHSIHDHLVYFNLTYIDIHMKNIINIKNIKN